MRWRAALLAATSLTTLDHRLVCASMVDRGRVDLDLGRPVLTFGAHVVPAASRVRRISPTTSSTSAPWRSIAMNARRGCQSSVQRWNSSSVAAIGSAVRRSAPRPSTAAHRDRFMGFDVERVTDAVGGSFPPGRNVERRDRRRRVRIRCESPTKSVGDEQCRSRGDIRHGEAASVECVHRDPLAARDTQVSAMHSTVWIVPDEPAHAIDLTCLDTDTPGSEALIVDASSSGEAGCCAQRSTASGCTTRTKGQVSGRPPPRRLDERPVLEAASSYAITTGRSLSTSAGTEVEGSAGQPWPSTPATYGDSWRRSMREIPFSSGGRWARSSSSI
jgi:hypothetical protein